MEELVSFLDLKNRKILLVLDYDGTLTEIVNNPMEATLTKDRRAILESLTTKKNIQIVINSGRPIEELLQITNSLHVDFLGNHGLFYREKDSNDYIQLVDPEKLKSWDKEMIEIREYLKSKILPNYENAWIQENKHGFVLHTRKMNPDAKNLLIIEMQSLFQKNFNHITYSTGKEIIEVKPLLIVNKAKGLEWYLKNKYSNYDDGAKILCIGDDKTDEDMFELVNLKKNGITIKIGGSYSSNPHIDTAAKIILESVTKLYEFIEEINKIAT